MSQEPKSRCISTRLSNNHWLRGSMSKHTWRDFVEAGIDVLCEENSQDKIKNNILDLKKQTKEQELLLENIQKLETEKDENNKIKERIKQAKESERIVVGLKKNNPLRYV